MTQQEDDLFESTTTAAAAATTTAADVATTSQGELHTTPSDNLVGVGANAEDNGAKPRLAIKKMVLENFKSYAGRVEIGPFHKVFPLWWLV